MVKYGVLSAALLALVACDPAVVGSDDSKTNRLRPEMTPERVESIIGAPLASDSLDDTGSGCFSYVYDEAISARFVHVLYENGGLVRATEGHGAPCGA